MKQRTVLYRPPEGAPYVKRVLVSNTKYLQDKTTGELKGRRRVKQKGDKISRKRVEKPFVLVRKSRTAKGYLRKNREEHNPGEFF
jgi:hypothetical protein